jgi:murein tripeptide amidase MpaA
MAYLNVVEVESAIVALGAAFPSLCEVITLPNTTHEGRTSRAMRLANGALDDRPAVLFIGGQHAREWGSGEICINFATDLLEAYTGGTGLVYGGKTFTSTQVQRILNNSQVFVFPCVNPDGRNHSQTVYSMWRKNRNPVAAVDINRNYDVVWDFRTAFNPLSPIQTSDVPSNDTYHGTAAHSEPETRNVVSLLDNHPQIQWMIDIHSYSKLLYHNWGDDQNQVVDPAMNFLNAGYNGQRGVRNDNAYREYINPSDLAVQKCLVGKMKDAIQAVRGVSYSTGQSFDLYPTSGTATDYPYSRHLVDPSKTKTHGFLIEWGTEFQPSWSEMENIIKDISAALVSFADATTCPCSSLDANLETPTLVFNDVPEGEQTTRAIVFSVTGCQAVHFEIVPPGPTVTSGPGSFGTFSSPSANLPAGTGLEVRESLLWISFTGTNNGDVTTGTVTVRLAETTQEWVIPITANTIARPTVGVVLVLDQSGSMSFNSGISALPTRNDVLKFAAPIFVHLIQPGNGVGIVDFDHDAFDRMNVDTITSSGGIDPVRNTALGIIGGHAPNLNGNTAIGDGIEHASNLLSSETDYDHKAMVVFTDGFETDGKYITEVAPLINDRVFAIALGTATQIQPTALSAITNGTGGYLLLTGDVGNDDLFKLSKYYLQILAGVTNMNIVLDPEGYVKPGQTHQIPFYLNEADISFDTILLHAAGKQEVFEFALLTPGGDVIKPSSQGAIPGIEYHTVEGAAFYRILLPVPIGAGAHVGKWHVLISVNGNEYKRYVESTKDKKLRQEIIAHGVRYNLNIHSYSGVRLKAALVQDSNEPGATLTLRASLSEYGMPVSKNRAKVRATFVMPDNSTGTLWLTEETAASGIFTASKKAILPGVYTFRIIASGYTLRGADFTREQTLTGVVWKGGDNPPPTSKDDPKNNGSFCDLIKCLTSKGVISKELEERWLKDGFSIEAFRKCMENKCKN